jgi:flagellar basal-body rod protein FlgB
MGRNKTGKPAYSELQETQVFQIIFSRQIPTKQGEAEPTRGRAMFANLTSSLDFHSKALVVRAQRQEVIASNIANADTPGYAARSLDFKQAMSEVMGGRELTRTGPALTGSTSHIRHLALQASPGAARSVTSSALGYEAQTQPSMDGNSVDLDRERAKFMDNAIRYESTLRFINGQAKTLLSAIQGQ